MTQLESAANESASGVYAASLVGGRLAGQRNRGSHSCVTVLKMPSNEVSFPVYS
jgi:hypothetical protein